MSHECPGNRVRYMDAFLGTELVERAVVRGRRELPPVPSVGRYFAAVDPSGGGADAFTLAIVHLEGRRIVHDVLRGWSGARASPVDLGAVTAEIAGLCHRYGLHEVIGDRYGAEWVRQAFREHGLRYYDAPWTRAQAYLELEPLLAQEHLELLDHPELARELRWLERRHHPGAHDDHANALTLAVVLALRAGARSGERPKGTDFGELAREARLTELRTAALARGISEETIQQLEDRVGCRHLVEYLEDMLEEGTLQGRLRRAGLSPSW